MSEFEEFYSTLTKYGSSIALRNFQLDRNWFKFHLQWYWTDFFEMTNIERISNKCSNSKSQFELQWFELELPYYLINLWWDECYRDFCDDISEFEVFFQRGLNMGHLPHWVIFNLISTGLSSNYNDIGQISLRWLI